MLTPAFFDALCMLEVGQLLSWRVKVPGRRSERRHFWDAIDRLSKCSTMRFAPVWHVWTLYVIRVE